MRDLTAFLTSVQTFDFQVVKIVKIEDLVSGKVKDGSKEGALWLTDDVSGGTFFSNMRLLKDMALINLILFDGEQSRRLSREIEKVQFRFKLFWERFHRNFDEDQQTYPDSILDTLQLSKLFVTNLPELRQDGLMVGADVIGTIGDSMKIREKLVTEILDNIASKLKDNEPPKAKDTTHKTVPFEEDAVPKFSGDAAGHLLEIIEPYFDKKQSKDLKNLLIDSTPSLNYLTFNGNGNQLADAFKQLFEANLIVGCRKIDLEKWIAQQFLYVQNRMTKEFTEGYLNGIISSDAKPCKSPILEVKKKNDAYMIVGISKNKKNAKF